MRCQAGPTDPRRSWDRRTHRSWAHSQRRSTGRRRPMNDAGEARRGSVDRRPITGSSGGSNEPSVAGDPCRSSRRGCPPEALSPRWRARPISSHSTQALDESCRPSTGRCRSRDRSVDPGRRKARELATMCFLAMPVQDDLVARGDHVVGGHRYVGKRGPLHRHYALDPVGSTRITHLRREQPRPGALPDRSGSTGRHS